MITQSTRPLMSSMPHWAAALKALTSASGMASATSLPVVPSWTAILAPSRSATEVQAAGPLRAGVSLSGAALSVAAGVSVLAAGVSAVPVVPPPQAVSRLRDRAAVRPKAASFLKFFMVYLSLFIPCILEGKFSRLDAPYYTPYSQKCNIYSFVKPNKKKKSGAARLRSFQQGKLFTPR